MGNFQREHACLTYVLRGGGELLLLLLLLLLPLAGLHKKSDNPKYRCLIRLDKHATKRTMKKSSDKFSSILLAIWNHY